MLERFKVPAGDEVRIPEDSLRETVTAVFEKMGVSPEHAAIGADTLVSTDLRGVETHGVSNMLRAYVKQFNEGSLNPRPEWKVVREALATATIDADKGLAIILGPAAMQMAIDKAKKFGVGVVTMFNAGHSGAIGHHALIAAKQDMVGMVMTAGGRRVLPTFGAVPVTGTNPIAYAAPSRNEPPLLFDAATSAISGNKVHLANRVDAPMAPGWVAEDDGTPIMEDSRVRELNNTNLLPLGGTRETGSHKGYGFGMMAELMTAMLTDCLPGVLQEPPTASHHNFAAYNVSSFTDLDLFKDNMDKMLRALRETPPAPGHDRVLYPGLSEYEDEQDRRANGIPLHKEVVQWFEDITGELSLPRLRTM